MFFRGGHEADGRVLRQEMGNTFPSSPLPRAIFMASKRRLHFPMVLSP